MQSDPQVPTPTRIVSVQDMTAYLGACDTEAAPSACSTETDADVVCATALSTLTDAYARQPAASGVFKG